MPLSLHLYNTMSRRTEEFAPREKRGPVKIFTCGPSIYNWQHIGNYRTFLFEDILERYLEFSGYKVDRLLNFTDVEDKAVSRAQQMGVGLEELTLPVEERFYDDCELLGIRLPEPLARSTTSVEQAVHLIDELLRRRIAYWHGIDVFYDPLRFKGFGRLYGLDMSQWPKKRIRFYKDTYPGQRWNRGDFILWKGWRRTDGGIFWNTALGKGRPAWNVQDPAMITKHLGYTLDICCGGIDNLVRHHDYNIAVVEGVSGRELARYWLHGEHVLIEGAKMSKSKGNIVYVKDLMARGYAPRHIRFFLSYGNYRSRLNLTEENLNLARGKADTFRAMVEGLQNSAGGDEQTDDGAERLIGRIQSDFRDRLNDDLDLGGAFDRLYDTVSKLCLMAAEGRLGRREAKRAVEEIRKTDSVMRIL